MNHFDEKLWANVVRHEDTELEPPAPAGALAAFERNLGLTLPAGHRAFLARSNGGAVGVAQIFGVGRRDWLDLEQQASQTRSALERTAGGPVLPFAKDWGGGYFCYDLRRRGGTVEYPVLYWNHEYSEEPDDLPMLWSTYAPNFMAFFRKIIT